jgi:hypothetical protein
MEVDGQTLLFMELERKGSRAKDEAFMAIDIASSDVGQDQTHHFMDVLAACQVADYVIWMTSAEEEVDALGCALLEAVAEQGVPSMVATIEVNYHS